MKKKREPMETEPFPVGPDGRVTFGEFRAVDLDGNDLEEAEKGHIKLGPVADGLTFIETSSLDDSKEPFFRLYFERYPSK